MATEQIKLENFIIPASQLEDECGDIFPTFLSLDIALNGGIPEGTNVLITGKPKTGKTSLSLHYVSQCQQRNKDKKVFFFDVEGRLRPELLRCIAGLDLNRFDLVRSNKDKILSAEDYLNLILQVLKDEPRCIVILDSIAALCPQAELVAGVEENIRMATVPSLMYRVFRQTSQILSVTKSTFIGLTHMISNPGYGKNTMSVGGNAKDYGASTWLEIPYKENITIADNKIIGQIAHVKVLSSSLGGPGSDVNVPIIYGSGIDINRDLFNVALEFGLIKQGGSWYTLPDNNVIPDILETDDTVKMQGEAKTVEYLKDNQEYAKKIDTYIRDMVFTT